jgi:hypothetical protein
LQLQRINRQELGFVARTTFELDLICISVPIIPSGNNIIHFVLTVVGPGFGKVLFEGDLVKLLGSSIVKPPDVLKGEDVSFLVRSISPQLNTDAALVLKLKDTVRSICFHSFKFVLTLRPLNTACGPNARRCKITHPPTSSSVQQPAG